jgi:formylglycine-generating enzyme required for sulfatase activity
LTPWWLLTGRENRIQQQALTLLAAGLPDRNDLGFLLALPRAQLTAIREQLANGVRSRDAYAAMMVAAEDVGFRYPELRSEVLGLRHDITTRFNAEFGLRPVDEAEGALNRRILIEGGSFLMGSPPDAGDPYERPQHRVTVSRFYIQEHEVTNAEYRRFDPNHDRLAPDDHPVVNVTWYEAAAYAAWIGGSLPTEAQWEFAARGADGRIYPWGNDDPTCARANFRGCGAVVRPIGDGRAGGQTPEQVHDLAGNVWEWCRDWSVEYGAEQQTDPLGPPSGSARVVRGGSFFNLPYDLRGVNRYRSAPDVRNVSLGFRVVWSAERSE